MILIWLDINVTLHGQVIQHVIEMFAIIERIFRKQYKEAKLYLWKNSGHPYVPRSKEAFDQIQEIFKFCDGLWPGIAESRDDMFYQLL